MLESIEIRWLLQSGQSGFPLYPASSAYRMSKTNSLAISLGQRLPRLRAVYIWAHWTVVTFGEEYLIWEKTDMWHLDKYNTIKESKWGGSCIGCSVQESAILKPR